jgi:hypothetical protein
MCLELGPIEEALTAVQAAFASRKEVGSRYSQDETLRADTTRTSA